MKRKNVKITYNRTPGVIKKQEYLTLLSKVSKGKDKKVHKAVVDLAQSSELNAVLESISNCLKGNLPLSANKKKKLHPYKNLMRKLAFKKSPQSKIKHILKSQKGHGLLSILLPTVLGALSSFIPSRK
jgi:hypothetical protein